ncbi:site-specific DNA-methyltransferase [Microbacterium laevaniformans]|uniref:Site-specific DNA-methyltransferase n=1 Tax=Microbacterium laevaniformans TaxID=36807 RepID=A0A4S2D045_9MICO|nr:site-specific DNA-methyltransferase [Microbacterium laevaniformans]TGY34366.1 site-specific DNA-methyltransferase [Microbacterium laevaniformans]
MEKRTLHSPDLRARNVERIAELFPQVITESRDAEGNVTLAIDFDLLRQELSDHVVEGPQERYQLDWPGKRAAAFAANAPIAKTLRPVRAESVDFDTTKNLFIEGDNLEALKLLQESYLGKVKLIYIDPPYNTGNDFVYDDDFAESSVDYLARSGQKSDAGDRLIANTEANGRFHSDWLSMMYPRIKLAKNLLTDDGVLVVSIDENEHASLVRLGEEVLGDASYVGEIVLKNSSKNDQAYISVQHEYIVFFVKNRQANPGAWVEKKEGLDKIYAAFDGFRKKHGDDWAAINAAAKDWYKQFPASHPVSASKHYTWMDARGVYFPDNIAGPNDGQYVYDVAHPETGRTVKMPSTGWRYPEAAMRARIADGRVHFGSDETTVPNNKTYLANTEYQSLTSVRYVDGRAASKRLAMLFGEKVFTNPKDEFLLRDIYRAVGVTGDDVVLDMFSGSGSALQAVIDLNHAAESSSCHFIGIQVAEDLTETLKTAKGAAKQITTNAIKLLSRLGRPATVAEITKQRMRLVHEQIAVDSQVDSGFRVLRIDTSNLTDTLSTADDLVQIALTEAVDSVKPDRTDEDLLFQVLLDWGLDLAAPITVQEVESQRVLSVDDDALIACFAKEITDDVVKTIAERYPLRAVFLDAGFSSDAARINAEQIFREVSPETEVRTI